jgi:hypothetical protein
VRRAADVVSGILTATRFEDGFLRNIPKAAHTVLASLQKETSSGGDDSALVWNRAQHRASLREQAAQEMASLPSQTLAEKVLIPRRHVTIPRTDRYFTEGALSKALVGYKWKVWS